MASCHAPLFFSVLDFIWYCSLTCSFLDGWEFSSTLLCTECAFLVSHPAPSRAAHLPVLHFLGVGAARGAAPNPTEGEKVGAGAVLVPTVGGTPRGARLPSSAMRTEEMAEGGWVEPALQAGPWVGCAVCVGRPLKRRSWTNTEAQPHARQANGSGVS